MSNINCSIKDVKGKTRGGMRECLEKKQVRYWGIKKIDDRLLENYKNKNVMPTTRIKLILEIAGMDGRLKSLEIKLKTKITDAERKKIEKEIKTITAKRAKYKIEFDKVDKALREANIKKAEEKKKLEEKKEAKKVIKKVVKVVAKPEPKKEVKKVVAKPEPKKEVKKELPKGSGVVAFRSEPVETFKTDKERGIYYTKFYEEKMKTELQKEKKSILEIESLNSNIDYQKWVASGEVGEKPYTKLISRNDQNEVDEFMKKMEEKYGYLFKNESKKVVKKVVKKKVVNEPELKNKDKKIIPQKVPLLEIPERKRLSYELHEMFVNGSETERKMYILKEDLKAIQEATKTTYDAKIELNNIKSRFELINKTILANAKRGHVGWDDLNRLKRLMMKNDTIIKWLKKQPNVKYEDNTPYYNREISKYSNFDIDHYNSLIDATKEYLQILPHQIAFEKEEAIRKERQWVWQQTGLKHFRIR